MHKLSGYNSLVWLWGLSGRYLILAKFSGLTLASRFTFRFQDLGSGVWAPPEGSGRGGGAGGGLQNLN